MNAIIIFLQMGKFACCEAMRFAREFGACPPSENLVRFGVYLEQILSLKHLKNYHFQYHVLLICSQYSGLRAKFIRKHFYVKPSMLKFQILLTTTNSKDLQRLMTFIKLIFRDYNNRLIQNRFV